MNQCTWRTIVAVVGLWAVAATAGAAGAKAPWPSLQTLSPGAFREIARLTGGAHATFDASAPHRLRELLGAVAAYAAGGLPALEKRAKAGADAARLLLAQMGTP